MNIEADPQARADTYQHLYMEAAQRAAEWEAVAQTLHRRLTALQEHPSTPEAADGP